MTHRLNAFLLAFAALVFLPFYWLLLANPGRDVAPYPLTIGQLRSLASSMEGDQPEGVEVYQAGRKEVSGNYYAAGSGMKRRTFSVLAFRLTMPGGRSIMIDSGSTAARFATMDGEAFLPRAQAAIDRELGAAALVLATSERAQHLGGLAAFAARPNAAQPLTHAQLNLAQVPGAATASEAGWPETLVLRAAITGSAPRAVAPGVVVIPTGAPSPGAQMVYVRLRSGREYLFAGDVAPFHVNFAELRLRSNLLDRDVPRSVRAAQMRWLVTLRHLSRGAPGLVVVPAHDIGWLTDPQSKSGLRVFPS